MMILEARFKVAISRKEYEESANPHKYADMTGLRWKIYAFNDEKSMATGIYLFDDVQAMNSHMSNLREAADHLDHVSDLELMVWDIQEALCKITRAPI
jgi:hypothetical protein